jgi:TonB family protein
MRRSWLGVIACLALAGILTPAQRVHALSRRPKNAADRTSEEDWKRRLHGVDDDLRASRWDSAKKGCDVLLAEMLDHITGGPGAAPLLATAVLFRAVAEAGLGRYDEAAWDRQVATDLDRRMAEIDLSIYAPARVLAPTLPEAASGSATAPPRTDLEQQEALQLPKPGELPEEGKHVAPPRKLSGKAPEYPAGLGNTCQPGEVIVEAILDETGKLLSPHFLQSSNVVLGLAAMEAIRTWRWQPAILEGRPVKVYYTLTVNFKVRRCVPPQ